MSPSQRFDDDKEPASTIASLSYYLYAISILLVAIGLIIFALLPSNQTISAIPLAIGTSILAALIVQSVYGRIAEERIVKKVAAETASAAVGYAKSVLHDHFTHVVPRTTYPRTLHPTREFRRDMAAQLRKSKIYLYKGDAASFAGFRLTKLATHPDLISKDKITICILDPRAERLVKQHARQKLRTKGNAYSKEDIAKKSDEIREEIFITLVALLDISHLIGVEVILHRESLFFRSEIFEDGLFVSYYLGGHYPGTYFFTRDTYIYEAFQLNFQQIMDCSDYIVRFGDALSEEEFCKQLEALGCAYDISLLRQKRDELYSTYEASLPFEPNSLF